jgi:hypothetical protein
MQSQGLLVIQLQVDTSPSTMFNTLLLVCLFGTDLVSSAKLLTIFPTASTKGIVECNADGIGEINCTMDM